MSKVVQAYHPLFFKQLHLEYKYIYLHVLKIISFVLYNRLGHKLYKINCFVDICMLVLKYHASRYTDNRCQ